MRRHLVFASLTLVKQLNAVMSTPAYLRSAVRGALCATRRQYSRLSSRIALVALAFAATACSDVTAPGRKMDRDAVENIIPAITDARRRVASGIADVSVRQQMTISLSNIELGMRADDVDGVEVELGKVATLMTNYGNRASGDRQEVSAVFLVLNGVQKIAAPNAASLLP
jgi:hypothetical protein